VNGGVVEGNRIDNLASSEYLSKIRNQYRKCSGRKSKTRLLNQYCFETGRSRKHVIRLLGSSEPHCRELKPQGAVYDGEVTEELVKVWELLGRPCGQRLKPLLDQEIDRLRLTGELKISDEVAQKLRQISSATIDRKLKAEKERKPREATYDGEITEALVEVWELLGRPCGQRLKPLLDQEMDRLRLAGKLMVSDEVAQKLVQISSATIDRKLKAEKAKLQDGERETPVRLPP